MTHRCIGWPILWIALTLLQAVGCTSPSHTDDPKPDAIGSTENVLANEAKRADAPYSLHVPDSHRQPGAAPIPLLVLIHGCLQSGPAMEVGTQMNQLADKHGFAVLYPNQRPDRHPINCWRWYSSENQKPDSGEIAEILSYVRKAQSEALIDAKRIFVAGLSSGSGIAASLLACHPDVFAGGALHSGPVYGYVDNEKAATELLKNGPPSRPPQPRVCDPSRFNGRLLAIQGTSDKVVNPKNADRLFEDFKPKGAKTSTYKIDIESVGANAYPATTTCRKNQGRTQACKILLKGLGHAWSGGADGKPFMDPKGLSSNELIYRFVIEGKDL